jgi:hypothetical protein
MPPHPSSSSSLSWEEELAARQRVLEDAYDRLVIGPGQAFLAAGCAVFGVGCWEGWQFVRPQPSWSLLQQMHFLSRYGLSNIIPSLIWGRQSAFHIASVWGLADDQKVLEKSLYLDELPPRRAIAVNRLNAIRGAIAGTILISQVISFANVSTEAKNAYSERIKAGREPPLNVTKKSVLSKRDESNTSQGVVIRLAGKTSDVTSLTLDREGRRSLFPVFEDPKMVQPLIQRHGIKKGNYFQIPLFWQVPDKQYGYPESWSDLKIPQSWLFAARTATNDKQPSSKKKLLILEADANREDAGVLSLASSQLSADLDLDLYEVAQGFYQLQQLVEKEAGQEAPECLCVLLADAESKIERGGGETMTIRQYVSKLGLADVVIDTQAPIVLALQQWLESKHHLHDKKGRKHVILETPEVAWFQSMKVALKQMGGYNVIDTMEAIRLYGSSREIPFLVYERTPEDTIHTIRRLIDQDITRPQDVCALCPTHQGLDESLDEGLEATDAVEVANICSSDLYDRLLRKVRQAAIKGQSNADIQRKLDENLSEMLQRHPSDQDWTLRIKL